MLWQPASFVLVLVLVLVLVHGTGHRACAVTCRATRFRSTPPGTRDWSGTITC
jgi:hypothetical protein